VCEIEIGNSLVRQIAPKLLRQIFPKVRVCRSDTALPPQ